MKLVKSAVIAILMLCLMLQHSCKTSKTGKDPSSELKAFHRKVNLGNAYNDKKGRYLDGATCLVIDPEVSTDYYPPNKGSLELKYDATYKDIMKSLTGSAQANLDFDAAKVDGNVQLANSSAKTSFRTNIMISYLMSNGYYQMNFNKMSGIKLQDSIGTPGDPSGLNSAQLEEQCGTRFVSGLQLSASFTAILTIEAKNESEKNYVKGKLQAAVAGVKAKGELEIERKYLQNSIRLSLKIKQFGGDATEIGKQALAQDATKCNTANIDACTATIAKLYDYARGFGKQVVPQGTNGTVVTNPTNQVDALKGYIVSNVHFTDYSVVDRQWKGEKPNPAILKTIAQKRDDALVDFLDEQRASARADLVLEFNKRLTSKERQDIKKQKDIISDRMMIISTGLPDNPNVTRGVQPCYDLQRIKEAPRDTNMCLNSLKKMKKELAKDEYKVDESVFTIMPKDYVDWCTKLKSWYVMFEQGEIDNADLIINPEQRQELMIILNVGLRDYFVRKYGSYDEGQGKKVYNSETFKKPMPPGLESIKLANPMAHPTRFQWFREADYSVNQDDELLKAGIAKVNCSSSRMVYNAKQEFVLNQKKLNDFDGAEVGISYGDPFSNFRFLRSLDLSGNTRLIHLKFIPKIKPLRTLRLDGTVYSPDDLSYNPFTALRLSAVRYLHLTKNDIGANGRMDTFNVLEGISNSKSLGLINLSDNPNFSDLTKLEGLPNLMVLCLYKTGFSKRGDALIQAKFKSFLDNKDNEETGIPNLKEVFFDQGASPCDLRDPGGQYKGVTLHCGGRVPDEDKHGGKCDEYKSL